MNVLIALSCWCLAAPPNDDPLPYSDDEEAVGAPTRPNAVPSPAANTKSLGSGDDPHLGLGIEALSALALPDAAQGGVDLRFSVGARITWEYGQLIPDDFLKEVFFLDLTYRATFLQDGTKAVQTASQLHHLSLAQAVAWPIVPGGFSLYGALGAGVGLTNSLTLVSERDPITSLGTKFLFQYGLGFRGTPALTRDGKVRLQIRIELMRYVRGYLHDMYIGGGVGLTF